MENSESSTTAKSDPGSLLREGREAMDISQREMADRLHWMPEYIGALEENRFEVLPGTAFVRGYIRAYAKQINVDEAELLSAYESLPGVVESAHEAERRIETKIPQVQKKGWALPAGIGIVLALFLLLWLVQGEDEPASTAPIAPVKSAAPIVPVKPATPIAPVIYAAETAAETATPIVIEPSSQDSDFTSVEAAAETELLSSPEPIAVSASAALLEFVFSGECWLEVHNGHDELIYADLRQAGDVLSLDGVPPFSVLVGDARYVELRYQGEPVAIEPRPDRVIARLMVGEI